MAVRSYTRGKMDEEKNKPRVRINRDNNKKVAEDPNSKTQKRKQNKAAHMQTTRGFK